MQFSRDTRQQRIVAASLAPLSSAFSCTVGGFNFQGATRRCTWHTTLQDVLQLKSIADLFVLTHVQLLFVIHDNSNFMSIVGNIIHLS